MHDIKKDELNFMQEGAMVGSDREEGTVGLGKWVYFIAIPVLLLASTLRTVRYFEVPAKYGVLAPPTEVLFVGLALLLVNPIARLFKSKFRIKTRDLVVIWMLGQIIITVGEYGFFSNWISVSVRMKWLQMRDPANVTYLSRFSSWLYVDNEDALINLMYGNQPVPWGAWIKPMITWAIFYTALIMIILCLSSLVRRRWTDQEHLSFGYARLQLAVFELVERPKWYRNPLLWLGVMVYTVFHGAWIQDFIPIWPQLVDLYLPDTIRRNMFAGEPSLYTAFYRWGHLRITDWPILWFAPSDFLLTTWLMEWIRGLVILPLVNGGLYGLELSSYRSRETIFEWPILMAGALGVGITYIWMMRSEIKEIWNKVRGRTSSYLDDSDEPIPMKWSFWGLIIGTVIVLLYMQIMLKVSLLMALFNTLMFVCFALTYGRMAAETGVFSGLTASAGGTISTGWLANMIDAKSWGANNLLGATLIEQIHDGRMPTIFHRTLVGLKMGDGANIKRRNIILIVFGAFLLGVVGSYLFTLPMFYEGGHSPDTWRMRYALVRTEGALGWLTGKQEFIKPNPYVLTTSIVSVLLIFVVGWGRSNFARFPFHPLGVWVGASYIGRWYLDPCFFVWILKSIVLRYGGVKLYRALIPFWIGVVLGDAFHILAQYLLTMSKLLLRAFI